MFLKSLSRFTRATAFRLTLWYSSIFILSSLSLFLLAYFLVSLTVRDQDKKMIQLKINEYVLMEQAEGTDALLKEIRQEHSSNQLAGFFVRVADSQNRTLILTIPRQFEKTNLKMSNNKNSDPTDNLLFLQGEKDEDVLQVTTGHLRNGYILQVGKGPEEREDLLERFREIFGLIMGPIVLIGLAAGAFLAFRSLMPIRDLINTVRDIDIGKMDARVPSNHTGDELDELVRLFNNMLEKIETLINGMQEALDNVAHDLRTPATRLRTVVETTLQSESNQEALREALMDCAEESERIMTMLTTLLDISEAESGVMRLNIEEADVAMLIKDVVELYQYVAEEKQISISAAVPEGLKSFMDTSRMKQVVANLLDNAIKYSKKGGNIDIKAALEDNELKISVKDNGVGIAPGDLSRIFDRLYRGDKSRSRRGLGLGLSLVQAVIHAHKGHIEVQSHPGEGSCFTVSLPRV
jgi:signal transduction histidine kinase